jgi:hypothetical protein
VEVADEVLNSQGSHVSFSEPALELLELEAVILVDYAGARERFGAVVHLPPPECPAMHVAKHTKVSDAYALEFGFDEALQMSVMSTR